MITITAEDLRGYARGRIRTEPRAELIAWLIEHQAELLPRYGVTSPERWAMFIAQVAHETGGLRILEENLHYSAERLCSVWPNRFPSLRIASGYAGNPEKLANFVYARKELGNLDPGDGWRYRGRGGIQITGEACYAEIAKAIGRPEILADPGPVASDPALWWETACGFWQSRQLSQWADKRDIRKCTLRINGGLNGYDDRKAWYQAAWALWGDGDELAEVYDPCLDLGDAGPRVEALQRRLAELHYPLGAIDGRFGKLTQGAVLAFQKEHGLALDGSAGPQTEAALATASPRDLGPRALADAEDLKAAGAPTILAAGALKTTAEAATGTAIALKVAEESGLAEWMRTATDGAGAFNGLVSALGIGLNLVASHLWVAVPLVGVVAWLLASQLIRARVEAHRTGQNLSV